MHIRADRIGQVSTTLQEMVDNSTRTNTSLHKAQRKEDKDHDKKTTKAAGTSSKGVGIGASSVGGQDLSNMGDMRGRNSDLFSNEDEEKKDKEEEKLKKDLDYFSKDKIFKLKMKHVDEEIDDEFDEDLDDEFDDDREKEKKDDKKEDKEKSEEVKKEDEVLDRIKDDRADDIKTSEKDKDLKDGDPKHRLKDKYSSSEEEKEEDKSEDIVLPHVQIKPTGIMMGMEEEESSDIYVSEEPEEVSDNKDTFFKTPPYEEEKGEVSDEIKNSPEYIKEQMNRERVKKLLVHYTSGKVVKNLIDQLAVLGEKILETCINFETKIVLLGPNQPLTDLIPGAADTGSLRAGYLENMKIVFLGEEWLYPEYQSLYRFNTAIYLMAMAFDHATGGDTFASLKSPFVLNNYHSCKRGEEGHMFIDGLSAYSPVEYFAQTMESFLQKEDNILSIDLTHKIFEGKLCNKKELYYTDISMYQYIDYLVQS